VIYKAPKSQKVSKSLQFLCMKAATAFSAS